MTLDMKRFDHLKAHEVQALPQSMRRMVIKDRKARVTAALQRYAAGRGQARPRRQDGRQGGWGRAAVRQG